MKTLFNPKPRTVRLTVCELQEFWKYLCKCDLEGFTGPNCFMRIQREREEIYKWHLKELAGKVLTKVLKHWKELSTKKLSIQVNEMQQRMLSAMFKRVDCTPYMLQLQERFINQLEKYRT